MSNVTGPRRPAVSSLPPRVKQMVETEQLFRQARETFKHSQAGKIDNVLFRQRTGLSSETAQMSDRSLAPYIGAFARDLDRSFRGRGGSAQIIKSVIEFGCGLGQVAALLGEKKFIQYTGVELAEPVVRVAKATVKNISFAVGDLLTYRTPRTFDAVIATDVLSALSPNDQLKAVLNLNLLLAAKGQLLLRWPAGENDLQIKTELTPGGTVQGWVFRATAGYIQHLLEVVGFFLNYQIETVPVLTNAGTTEQTEQPHHIVFAGK
jgi:SAM-dependent methyltransferase